MNSIFKYALLFVCLVVCVDTLYIAYIFLYHKKNIVCSVLYVIEVGGANHMHTATDKVNAQCIEYKCK
jgi:hypothetical protein